MSYRATVKHLQPLKPGQLPPEYNRTGEGATFNYHGFTVMLDRMPCDGHRLTVFCPSGQVFAVYLDPDE